MAWGAFHTPRWGQVIEANERTAKGQKRLENVHPPLEPDRQPAIPGDLTIVCSIIQRRRPRRWPDSFPSRLLEDAQYIVADPEGIELCLLNPKWY